MILINVESGSPLKTDSEDDIGSKLLKVLNVYGVSTLICLSPSQSISDPDIAMDGKLCVFSRYANRYDWLKYPSYFSWKYFGLRVDENGNLFKL